ncbi:type I pullulanase [Salipaludibacillus keqinensis]|uniref:Type I pullulanase n=1 Tax=Salipaludibacillus keqinensis TaxID=2045207 RepID=A0A323TEU9_9BACI|nr:type I pullulanase [Salipaludibacillus keqinensis]PYZ93802.1 type I pullulanase [Salipaludibacillus keqinensis]
MGKYKAWLDDIHFVEVEGNDLAEDTIGIKKAKISVDHDKWTLLVEKIIDQDTVLFRTSEALPIGKELMFLFNDKEIPVHTRKIVRTEWFEKEFAAPNAELGATYHSNYTVFRVWSPVATDVVLSLSDEKIPMIRTDKGVWECSVDKDCHGLAYLYLATVNGRKTEVVDPYAKALTVNSRAAVVANLSKTDPNDFKETPKPVIDHLQNSSIYEIHVRDATIHQDSGVLNKGKYLGLTEKNTKTKQGYSTGLDYIKDLGVTHVQLLPVNDFARIDDLLPDAQYNWGYDPLFYQVPEGSFSVDPTDPFSRITELKSLIQAIHKEELSVILDVVYNHVFIMEESSFEKLVPGYYFRYHFDGSLSNGTGVGNDIASERIMVRKFILDTIDYWLSEYRIDGFRFDLMGTLDIDTMNEIERRCQIEENPIMLLGEGWELPTAFASEQRATSSQSHQVLGIRFFNDFFRDSVKGNLFDFYDYGYINGKGKFIERLPQLVKGSSGENETIPPFVHEVTQTVNYVECHDNHTLWDRLKHSNGEEAAEERREMHKLATGLTIVSQGIPFLHAGQEWFRSKKGDGNSYISPDEINQLDWSEREKREDHIHFVRSLLKIRNDFPVFRMKSKAEIDRRLHILSTPAPVFGFTLLGNERDFCVYVNPTRKRFQIILPSPGNWEILVSSTSNASVINTSIIGEYTELEPYEFLLIKKSRV